MNATTSQKQQIQFSSSLFEGKAGRATVRQQIQRQKHMIESAGVANIETNFTVKRGRPTNVTSQSQNSVQLTMKQSRKLVYVTIKTMLRRFGNLLPKGGKMTLGTWEEIAKTLNAMPGMYRPAKLWARCFVSKKHFVSTKFKVYMQKQANLHGRDFKPDWSNFSHFDLLLLQEYRQFGYPDMPDVHSLLRTIEKYKLLDVDWQLRFPKEGDDATSMYAQHLKNSPASSGQDDEVSMISEAESSNRAASVMEQSADTRTTQRGSEDSKQLYAVRKGQTPYLTYLAYLAGKQLLKRYGQPITKHNGLRLKVWQQISDQMYDKMGIRKLAKQWRKTYSANKYVVHTRFLRRLREQPNGRLDRTVDWSKVRVEELLSLQSLRAEGFEDMPALDVVLRAYERNQEFLSLDVISNASVDAEQNSWRSPSPDTYNTNTIEIKSEPVSDFSAEEISDQPQREVYVKSEVHTDGEEELDIMPATLAYPLLNAPNDEPSSSLQVADCTRAGNDQPSHVQRNETSFNEERARSTPYETQESDDTDRRLLELTEKILHTKVKKNKILRRRNKILEEHSKLFGQLLSKLDVLIEKKDSVKPAVN